MDMKLFDLCHNQTNEQNGLQKTTISYPDLKIHIFKWTKQKQTTNKPTFIFLSFMFLHAVTNSLLLPEVKQAFLLRSDDIKI